jgi:hypothetical protein
MLSASQTIKHKMKRKILNVIIKSDDDIHGIIRPYTVITLNVTENVIIHLDVIINVTVSSSREITLNEKENVII